MISTGGGPKPLRPTSIDPQQIDQKFRQVGDLYEKQFLREMVKQMRNTIPEGGIIPTGMGEKIFREQLDQEYVETWGSQGGIGLSDLIYKQLVDKFGERMGLKAGVEKPMGPIPITMKENFRAQFPKPTPGPSTGDLNIQVSRTNEGEGQPTSLLNPWRGELLGVYQLADGYNLVDIKHDDGLRSRLHFKGALASLQVGDQIEPGQSLGVLPADSNSFNWKVSE